VTQSAQDFGSLVVGVGQEVHSSAEQADQQARRRARRLQHKLKGRVALHDGERD